MALDQRSLMAMIRTGEASIFSIFSASTKTVGRQSAMASRLVSDSTIAVPFAKHATWFGSPSSSCVFSPGISMPEASVPMIFGLNDSKNASASWSIDFYMVKGNCDFGAQAPETILTELGGVRLFLTHGHLFGVKTGLTRLRLEADRVGAQIALFGHTHRPLLEEDGGVWYMNSGAARDGRYGVIEIKNGTFTCELKKLPEE